MENPIIIIGGGLTGLTCAHELIRNGKKVLLLEKSEWVGGSIQTHKTADFIYEEGPNTGIISNVECVRLFDQLKEYCQLEIASEAAKKRYILKDGEWRSLPSSLWEGVTTPLFTFSDKLRILAEPFREKGINPSENLEDLVLRRLGRSFLDYAVDPFIGGIYSGNPKELITKYALPKLYALEQNYGSFIRGSIQKGKEKRNLSPEDKKANNSIFSFMGGLEELPKALLKSIGKDSVRTNCKDIKVTKTEKGYNVTWRYNNILFEEFTTNVVTCVGAYELENILPFIPKSKMFIIGNQRQAPIITVSMGFNHWEGKNLDGFGGLIPSKEKRNLLGVLSLSSCFKNRAPEGGALLTAFLGGMRHPEFIELNDNEIYQLVEIEMKQLYKLHSFNPILFQLKRHNQAIPQYDISSENRIETLNLIKQKYKGLTIGGNIFQGIGIPDRIKQGVQIATSLL